MTVPSSSFLSTFCARDFRSPCPLRPMVTGQHRYLHSRFQRCKCKDNPCPCIYCPYTTNTPRLMIIQSMTRWVEVESSYFDTVISNEPPFPPVLFGLVKEIALYITVWRCGLKGIYWSCCVLFWPDLILVTWHSFVSLLLTFSSLEHDFTIVKWPVVGRHSSILSFLLI